MSIATAAVEEELAALENGRIDPKDFPHSEHLRFAYEMLGVHSFGETVTRFSRGLRRLTEKSGRAQVYHETITVAFLALIAERRAIQDYSGWSDFVARNEDLLEKSILRHWYSSAQLESDLARKVFCLPWPFGAQSVSVQVDAQLARTDRTSFAYTLVFCGYIMWSSLKTAMSAHGHAAAAVLFLALAEVVGSLLFALSRTRNAGLVLLLVVFAIAFTLSVSLGESSVRFAFYAATAFFIWQLSRRRSHFSPQPKSS